jgi:alpha-glucosidase
MRFWLRRGIDGFRVDVIWHLVKDDLFRDNPSNPNWTPGRPPHEKLVPLYTADRPEVHDVIAEMRRVVDEFSERVLIGEIYLPIERLVAYYGRDLSGVHLPFNFSLLQTAWNAGAIARLVDTYEAALPPGGWPNWVLGNHDRARVASRVGRAQARNAAILLLTLRGTPTIYYGDELGMTNVAIPPDSVQDPFETNVPGLGVGRDGCRTPMQWDAGAFAGFSTTAPWLPVAPDFRDVNVEAAREDAASLLNLHRRLVRLRRERPVLVNGAYRALPPAGDLLLFWRELGRERLLVALNLGDQPSAGEVAALRGRILVSSAADRDGEGIEGRVALRANEGLVIDASP